MVQQVLLSEVLLRELEVVEQATEEDLVDPRLQEATLNLFNSCDRRSIDSVPVLWGETLTEVLYRKRVVSLREADEDWSLPE